VGAQKKDVLDYAAEAKPEVTGFGKGRRKGRTPAPSKF